MSIGSSSTERVTSTSCKSQSPPIVWSFMHTSPALATATCADDRSSVRWGLANTVSTHCAIQEVKSSVRNQATFCSKTIHRPHCCAALARSIYDHDGDDRPLIHVLDDGKPDLRFSAVCPDESGMVDRLIESEHDISLSADRNCPPDTGPRRGCSNKLSRSPLPLASSVKSGLHSGRFRTKPPLTLLRVAEYQHVGLDFRLLNCSRVGNGHHFRDGLDSGNDDRSVVCRVWKASAWGDLPSSRNCRARASTPSQVQRSRVSRRLRSCRTLAVHQQR